jgi:hypothetical protein
MIVEIMDEFWACDVRQWLIYNKMDSFCSSCDTSWSRNIAITIAYLLLLLILKLHVFSE